MRVFLTGPAATPYSRDFLCKCALTLREQGFDCFVPHERDWQPNQKEAALEGTLRGDYEALKSAEALVAILDGYTVDDGVAAQLGAFYALMEKDPAKKGIVGLLFDTRVAGWDWEADGKALNYFVLGCVEEKGKVCASLNQVLCQLREWSSSP
ncbi:MAG: nucleoside 2-deoxyribosyltransferase [Deltaproteobacteria bacterium]|nr:nucleoside 2-deoxyribosyltransferase [Deltaproteobacteria bacterium]